MPWYHSSQCTEWIMKHICAFVLLSNVCSVFHSLSDLVIQSDLLQDEGGGALIATHTFTAPGKLLRVSSEIESVYLNKM